MTSTAIKTTYLNSTKSCYKKEDGVITVYFSYNTPVLLVLADGTAYKTEKKFSSTTSKQITVYINKDLNYREVKTVSNGEFKELLKVHSNYYNLGWL